jgi:hypothetical protein
VTRRQITVPLDDDFLRDDLDPAEQERRRLAVDEAIVEAEKVKARLRREAAAEAKSAKAAS